MVMEKASQHTFIILTKQPQNIDLTEPIPKNVWIGVSVNTQKDVWRIDVLRDVHTSVRIVSFEPLYEAIVASLKDVDWVIIGAQTRPLVTPKTGWVQNLIQSANLHQIPVFLKNNLKPEWETKKYQEYPLKVK